jgi:monoamine oxidase
MNQAISDVDTIIVGAGAAGLAAGRELARQSASFVILEARSRLGGRAWTQQAGGAPVDLGAGWLHSADSNPFVALAQEFGIAVDRSKAPWQKDCDTRGFPVDEQRDYRRAWARFYERLEAAEESTPDHAAAELLEPGCRWNGMIDAGSTFINGTELANLSVVDFGRYIDTNVNYRVAIGFGALVARLGETLPVVSDCEVFTIDHSGKRLRVETSSGTFTANKVIVTVPTNVLAEGGITFRPELPRKIAAAHALPLGLADKLFLAFDRAQDLPEEARLYGRKDRTEIASYHLRPFGRPLIECYFGGAFARQLEAGGMAAFADYAIADIASVLGAEWLRKLRPVACSGWAHDPFARGSYSYARVGCSDQRAVLAAPVEDRIFFAGEATSKHDFSTVHGAYRTGLQAAREVLGPRTSWPAAP